LYGQELEQQIKYWESKYETDTKEIEKKLENLKTILKEKTVEVETLKETVNVFYILHVIINFGIENIKFF